MKSFVFLRNKTYRPSSYYRIFQYIQNGDFDSIISISEFESNGFYSKNKIYKIMFHNNVFTFIVGYFRRMIFLLRILAYKKEYNIVVQREVFPRKIGIIAKYILKKVINNGNRVYWDFDDNIFDANEITNFEKSLLLKNSAKIIVGNEFLHNKVYSENSNIEIIRTTDCESQFLNLDRVTKIRLKTFKESLDLVWIGTYTNIGFLEDIIPYIDEAANRLDKKINLKIVSNSTIDVVTKNLNIVNIKWTRDVAIKEMTEAHIGLMPLIDNEITRGKCAFKAVQYIGMGLPIIVSDVGMNSLVIDNNMINGFLVNTKEEWVKSIIELSDEKKWLNASYNSRNHWLKKFNSKKNEELIHNILKGS